MLPITHRQRPTPEKGRRAGLARALLGLLLLSWPTARVAGSEPAPMALADAGTLFSFNRAVEDRVRNMLHRVGLGYPPEYGLTFVALKAEQKLEVWAHTETTPRLIKTYPFTATSGLGGPKQKRGDRQIPEGLYQVIWLNPNSAYHLSLKVDYPNAFDRARAAEEGRTDLGGDIFIHGGAASIGCIAIGNVGIEELFVLTLMAGSGPAEVIIAPYDFRTPKARPPLPPSPTWLPTLYEEIKERLTYFTIPIAEQ